jgi:hypothetical protein
VRLIPTGHFHGSQRIEGIALGLYQPMVDVVPGAAVFEGVRPNEFSWMSSAAELVFPGVVKWVPLSVRPVWSL